MTYGHFSVMGGFVVDVSHLHNSLSHLTISPKGIAFLARHGHFLRISESCIQDKSKADVIAKVLACIQVTWMLIQTVERKRLGLPITLLEIHTLVHVGCAITMFGLWFRKPLDIREPVWVEASGFQDLLALMLVRNYGFGNKLHVDSGPSPTSVHSLQNPYQTGSECSYLNVYSPRAKHVPIECRNRREADTSLHRTFSYGQKLRPSSPTLMTHQAIGGVDFSLEAPKNMLTVCCIVSGQSLSCGIGPALSVRSVSAPQLTTRHNGSLSIPLSNKDVQRWNLAAKALSRTGGELHRSEGSANYFTTHAPNIFIDRKGLQAGFYGYFCAWASGGLIAALAVCSFYGIAHMLAWQFEFPTRIEQMLWRVACIDIIAGTITTLAIFSITIYLLEHDWKSLCNAILAQEPGIMPWIYRLFILIGVVNLPFFLVSRIFIIVESFISIRRVSLGVYATVDWSEYVPHF